MLEDREPLDVTGAVFRLEQKVAVVTGGASGYRAPDRPYFWSDWRSVAVLDLQAERAAEIARASNQGSRGFLCDVSSAGSVAATIDEVMMHYGRIDILVNCAGGAAHRAGGRPERRKLGINPRYQFERRFPSVPASWPSHAGGWARPHHQYCVSSGQRWARGACGVLRFEGGPARSTRALAVEWGGRE